MAVQIEGFKLHVSHSTRPFSARARYAPEGSLRPERVSKDLSAVKKLASVLEDEAAELLKLPDSLPEPRNLPRSKGGELPDDEKPEETAGGDDAPKPAEDKAKPQAEPMALDDRDHPPRNRGSVAVEERLEKLFVELEAKGPHADGGDEDAASKKVLEEKKVC